MNKVILTDIDNTICLYSKGIEEFTASIGLHPHKPIQDFWLMDECYGITIDQCNSIIKKFWQSDLFGKLEPEPCAEEVIPRMHKNGWKFVAITAACETTKEKRAKNLKNVFGFEWDAVHCTENYGKKQWLKAYSPSVWVEDNLQHAIEGSVIGHKTYLIDRLYNRVTDNPVGVYRVPNWYEIENDLENRNDV